MDEFKQELERRREQRRRKRTSTWTNFFFRILALIFVILIIRYFASRAKQPKNSQKFFQPDTVEVQKGY